MHTQSTLRWRVSTRLILLLGIMAAAMVLLASAPKHAEALEVGAYVPGYSVTSLQSFENLVGKKQSYYLYFYDGDGGFQTSLAQQLVNRGTTPIVTWEPFNKSLDGIANGSYDSYLRTYANSMKSVTGTIIFRPMHEMNGNWYPWGAVSGNTPAKYVAAWRHLVDVFRSQGATNVKFLWAPNQNGLPDWTSSSIPNYFPGDNYIDYAGIDGYNFGGSSWQSFSQVFGGAYSRITGITSKPIIIAETASDETGGNKAAWITDAFAKMRSTYPQIKALVWFHVNKERPWNVDSSSSSLAAYRTEMANLGTVTPPPTTTSLTVGITSPAAGTTLSGTATVSASVSGTATLARTELLVDGAVKGTSTSATPAFSWDTTTVSNAAHSIAARSFATDGRSWTSPAVTVNVNNVAPAVTSLTVGLTSPAAGSTLSGTVNMAASVYGTATLAKTEFLVDGVIKGVSTSMTPTYSWDTRLVSNGSHSVYARSYDTLGRVFNSATVSVNVSNVAAVDTTGPAATLTKPTASTLYRRNIGLMIEVAASDPSGIKKVDFYIDGTRVNENWIAPYDWYWNIRYIKNGYHTIKAVAIDMAGNTTTMTKRVYVKW